LTASLGAIEIDGVIDAGAILAAITGTDGEPTSTTTVTTSTH